MKRILLFDTAIATANQGDEIIIRSAKSGLQSILDESMVFRLGTHIENFPFLQVVLPNWKIKHICDEADYKFVLGTNLLSSDLSCFHSQWMLNPINKRLYKNAVLVGVGRLGEYIRPNLYTRYIYKHCLSKEYYHSTSDEQTKQVLEKMGFKAINTGCPTLWQFTKESCEKIPTKKAKKAIIAITGHKHLQDRNLDQRMIDIVKHNYEEIFVWMQTTDDEEYLNSLENTDNMQKIYSLNKYENILKNGEIDYIGSRLHGGIFALQNGVRSIIIIVDERARGFYECNNIPAIERKNIDRLDDMINSSFKTDINVNREGINRFLGQFDGKL